MRFPEFTGEWEETGNNVLFEVVSEKNREAKDNIVLSASQTEGMIPRDSIGIDIKYEKESLKGYKIVKKGDYVIHLRSFQGGFAFANIDGICSPAYVILRPTNLIEYSFLSSYFSSKKFISSLKLVTYGIRDGKSISVEEWIKLKSFIPHINEQQKITNFIKLLNQRIKTQNKIIEKYESLMKGISDLLLHSKNYPFRSAHLGSLCSIKKGEQVNALELTDAGSYYVMNGGITASGYYSEYNSEADTISISEGGNSCGYVQYNTSKFWSGGHCYTLNGISQQILNKYLYYYLKIQEKNIQALRVGSGLPNIQKKNLERFEVQFPNYEEQEKIANALSSIDQKILVERSILENFSKQKKSMLHNMFV